MKRSLESAVKRAQANLAPKPQEQDDLDPLAIAAEELVSAKTPQQRAEAARALVQLASK